MTTLKSCSIDDQYKHVSFKDLEGYLRKDDYLSGYCEAEKELIRQNLGIEVYKVDSKLSDLSTNPVENKAIAKALKIKADIDKLPKVAITGDYCDLHHKPHYLPNPEFLVIVDSNGTVGYNGEAPVKVKLPTHMSELTNDVGYLTEETMAANYVKGIKPNEEEDILWPEDGIITLDINKITGVDHELSITSTKPVENKVITRALKHIQEMYNNVAKKLNDLEDISDAEHPENGQLLSYVKEDGCEGYWKPVEIPKAGDVLEFDGTSWKPVNLNQRIDELINSYTIDTSRVSDCVNIELNPDVRNIKYGSQLTITLTPKEGKVNIGAVSIKMGEEVISSYPAGETSIQYIIPAVTDNIVISADCGEDNIHTVTYTLEGGGILLYKDGQIVPAQSSTDSVRDGNCSGMGYIISSGYKFDGATSSVQSIVPTVDTTNRTVEVCPTSDVTITLTVSQILHTVLYDIYEDGIKIDTLGSTIVEGETAVLNYRKTNTGDYLTPTVSSNDPDLTPIVEVKSGRGFDITAGPITKDVTISLYLVTRT